MGRYSELDMRREATADIIEAEGVLIALMRDPAPVADGAGGFVASSDADAEPQPPAKRYLAPSAVNVRSGNLRQEDPDELGRRAQVKYVMIGPYDDDVQKNDWFVYNGQKLMVVSIYTDRSYETRCGVIDFGDRVA